MSAAVDRVDLVIADPPYNMILAREPPLVFRRYLPDGTHEDCALQSLQVESLRLLM
jgi:DNA modification methylase